MAPSEIRLLICSQAACWQANLDELVGGVTLFERGLKGCLKVRISPLWAIVGVRFCYKPNLRTSNLKPSLNVFSTSRTASKKKACSAGEFRTGLLIAWITTCIHSPRGCDPCTSQAGNWTLQCVDGPESGFEWYIPSIDLIGYSIGEQMRWTWSKRLEYSGFGCLVTSLRP